MADPIVPVPAPTPKLEGLPNELLQHIWIFSENLDLSLVTPALAESLNDGAIRAQILPLVLLNLMDFWWSKRSSRMTVDREKKKRRDLVAVNGIL